MLQKNPGSEDDQIFPEQHLWRCVLLQVLIDALSGNTSMEARLHRNEARWWIDRALRGKNRSFVTICDLSGMDVAYVKSIFRRELKKRKII